MGQKLSQLTFLFSTFFEIITFSQQNHRVFDDKCGFYSVEFWVEEGGGRTASIARLFLAAKPFG